MANRYLLSSQPDGGSITYFTANASGDLVSIGSTLDYAQGFDDAILALLDNNDYKTLENGKLWIDTDLTNFTVTVESLNEGTIESTNDTCINLEGYSGINAITITGTGGRAIISFDGRQTWYTRAQTGLKEDGTTPIYGWVQVNKADVGTLGTPIATINSLVFADYAPIFQRTNLDFLIHIKDSEEITNLVVSLPPNGAPVISNFAGAPSTIHKEDLHVTFDVIDAEGEQSTYKVELNGVEIVANTNVPVDGHCSVTIPNTSLTLDQSAAIKVTATDPRGASSSNTVYVTKTDTAPAFVTVLNGNKYTVTISDPEGDTVKYRILFNGTEVQAYSDLLATPITFTHTIDKSTILHNQTNTIRIEAQDDMGKSGSIEDSFVGTYYGLMFTDPADDSYYTTDIGTVLKQLDFGTIIATQTSLGKPINIKNKTASGVIGVTLTTDAVIGQNIHVELSEDADFTNPGNSINLGVITQNEEKPFYIRVKTDRTSYGSRVPIIIHVEGTPVV